MAKLDLETVHLNAQEFRELAQASKDVFFFSSFCYVIHPVKGKVNFNLYPYQMKVLYYFLKERFNIILKFRQAGITELISMYCLWLSMYHPNKKINIISIKDTVAKKVLKKIKYMYKNLPKHLQVPIINGRTGELGTSCITGDTIIFGKSGKFRVDSISPTKPKTIRDVSKKGLYVLTHTGKYKKVLKSINKGVLETWEIVDEFGRVLRCTPKHRLYTNLGWNTVEDIVKRDLTIVTWDPQTLIVEEKPITIKPPSEIIIQTKYPGYWVSNWGRVFSSKKKYGKGLGRKHINLESPLVELTPAEGTKGVLRVKLRGVGNQKLYTISRLVAETFIGTIPKGYVVDHIDCNNQHNWVTNLQIITFSENTKRAYKYNESLVSSVKQPNIPLQLVSAIKSKYKEYGFGYGVAKQIQKELKTPFDHKRVSMIGREVAYGYIKPTKVKLLKKTLEVIYDIEVEDDHSYITDNGYINHNTSIEFINGSFIDSIPTTEDAGRSESLSLLVIDEAAIVRWASSIWASALPTLSCAVYTTPILLQKQTSIGVISGEEKFKLDTQVTELGSICPKTKGTMDISNLGYYTLTHKGNWERVTHGVNKGVLETWYVEDEKGKQGGYTPEHKLYTTNGWKTVREIIKNDLYVTQVETKLDSLNTPPTTHKAKKEELKPIKGFSNYRVSNWGNVYKYTEYGDLKLVPQRLNKFGYYRVGLTKPGVKRTLGSKLSPITGEKLPILKVRSKILELNSLGISHREIAKIVYPTRSQGAKFIKRILNEREGRVYISKLKVVKKTKEAIFDISVKGDHSYISANNFINHNTGGSAIVNSTPVGVGGFYHSKWVESITDPHTVFNPIRLYWKMHPERDQAWYDEMAKALGPKRTAQEIDGDFLSSGSTVFDLTDIKAIEDMFSEYPLLSTRLSGQLRIYDPPERDTNYFIGADVATGKATDYSTFTLGNRGGEEAAVFKGRIPVDRFARLLGKLGEEYNWATLAPEVNDIGLAVVNALQTEGYPNLYYYTKILKKKKSRKPEVESYPGWLTTSKNRGLIIDGLEEDIRKDNITCKDPFFTNEAYTFIYDGMGRPVAMGKHKRNSSVDIDLEGETYSDDSIFGKAIYNHIRKSYKEKVIILPPK